MNYENMTADELEKEAYLSDNTLALALYARVREELEDAVETAETDARDSGYSHGYDVAEAEGKDLEQSLREEIAELEKEIAELKEALAE